MQPEKLPDEVEQLRSSDMGGGGGKYIPQKTWFFQRGDGKIFPTYEKEAWEIINNRSEWRRHDFKILGVSDGTTYEKIVKESMIEARKLEPKIEEKKQELRRYQRAEEKIIENEVVDMEDKDDPDNAAHIAKIMRLRKIMDRIHKELDKLETEYRNATGDVVRRATDAELEAARGNIVYPQAMNIMTPGVSDAERQRILRTMGKA